MSRKQRVRLIALALLAAVLVAVVGVWARAAFRATGIEKLRQKSIPPQAARSASIENSTRASSAPAPILSAADVVALFFGEDEVGLNPGSPYQFFSSIVARHQQNELSSDEWRGMQRSGPGVPEELSRLALNLSIRYTWIDRSPEQQKELREKTAAIMSRMEPVLLGPLADDLPRKSQDELKILQLTAELCICRHVIDGEEEEALELIDRWGMILRQMMIGPDNVESSEIVSLAAMLSLLPETSEAVHSRIEATLRGLELAPSDIDRLRASKALMANTMAKEEALNEHNAVENTYHHLLDGKVEAAAKSTMAPVLQTQIDELTVSMAAGDSAGYMNADASIRRTLKMMNIDPDVVANAFDHMQGRDAMLFYQSALSKVELDLLFERDIVRQWKDTVDGALFISTRLLHPELKSEEEEWIVGEIPAFGAPIHDPGRFREAVRAYYLKYGRYPSRAEDFGGEEGIATEDIASWKDKFISRPRSPLFIRGLQTSETTTTLELIWLSQSRDEKQLRYCLGADNDSAK